VQSKRSKTVKITGLNGQSYIAVGLSVEKQLSFEGTTGDFFGALNNGSILNLKGSTQRFLGDTMNKGGIILQGNAKRGVGTAMKGGIIVVRGNVAGDVGQLLNGGTILISGKTGSLTGAYMRNGEIIVAGDVGSKLGLNMVGGAIFVGGNIVSTGDNTRVRKLTNADKSRLLKYFSHYGIKGKIENFQKVVPSDKNPISSKLFDFDNKNKITSIQRDEIIDEILKKTETGKLKISGSNFNNLIGPRPPSNSILDNLAIIPNQTQPISSIDLWREKIDLKCKIGGTLGSPIELAAPIILASRGVGTVSKSCKMALVYAAGKHKIAVDTGGLTYPEEFELRTKYGGKFIHQWNIDRMGVGKDYITNANGIQLVLGFGGSGGLVPIIPSNKLNDELIKILNIQKGTELVLPTKLFDFDVPADLKRHVELLREVTDYKLPIMVKISTGNVYDDTRLALRAGADAVILEGPDTFDQNLPNITSDNLGIPTPAAIQPAIKAFKDARAPNKGNKLVVSGFFKNGADIFKTLALGADCVVIKTAAEVAMGCKLCGLCHTNSCEAGIGTTDPNLETKLDWIDAGEKLSNFLNTLVNELKLLMILSGSTSVNDINKNNLYAMDYNTATQTGTKLIGYDKLLPVWEH
jgi:glutamate synthase domain-containing protein 2